MYAQKFARGCGEEESCFKFPHSCPGMETIAAAYTIWRNYLDPAMKNGLDLFEVILDRMIKISPME